VSSGADTVWIDNLTIGPVFDVMYTSPFLQDREGIQIEDIQL